MNIVATPISTTCTDTWSSDDLCLPIDVVDPFHEMSGDPVTLPVVISTGRGTGSPQGRRVSGAPTCTGTGTGTGTDINSTGGTRLSKRAARIKKQHSQIQRERSFRRAKSMDAGTAVKRSSKKSKAEDCSQEAMSVSTCTRPLAERTPSSSSSASSKSLLSRGKSRRGKDSRRMSCV
ncbi:expressed unknown protein [Seminavis robusta]|uniref:Uncharacterized protein n=1 Tax=Seminavis robusta TaxID=568900 RepID=A0A9N8H8W2_9STRA|nr:expressed unknown protein [Seminavis robusta]|eukprot:Sro183_g079751.1  (177) ;mRNA; f:84792-85322